MYYNFTSSMYLSIYIKINVLEFYLFLLLLYNFCAYQKTRAKLEAELLFFSFRQIYFKLLKSKV